MNKQHKIFFIKLAVFILMCIGIDFFAGKLLISLHMSSDYGESAHYRDIMFKEEAELMIFGCSRGQGNYVSQIFEDSLKLTTYNCGHGGLGILFEYGILQKIFERHTPKVTIIDIFSPYDIIDNGETPSKYISSLKPLYGSNAKIDELFSHEDKTESIKLNSSLYRFNSEIFRTIYGIISSEKLQSKKGFIPFTAERTKVPHKWDDENSKQIDPIKMKYLEQTIIDFKDSTKLIFVISPYYKLDKKKPSYEAVYSLCHKYDIPLLDYQGHNEIINVEEYWGDGVHLKEVGAKAFSSIVAKDIKHLCNNKH